MADRAEEIITSIFDEQEVDDPAVSLVERLRRAYETGNWNAPCLTQLVEEAIEEEVH